VHAEILPRDYHTELANAAADTIAAMAKAQQIDEAEAFAARWRSTIGVEDSAEDAKLSYELGLGWRLAGRPDRALTALDAAIKADPTMVAAHYDRGELRLHQGDLDAAKADFTAVSEAEPTAWPGHFRLADVAGRQGDVATFEQELTAALRCGFSFRSISGDPRWREVFHDPTLGPAMQRLITVYQGEDVFTLFEEPN
jgi:tetratricopeptide (TPR) repeat protein